MKENIDVIQKQIRTLRITRQNTSLLTEKVEQLQKEKRDLVKTMEKMAGNNTCLSKENQLLKSEGVRFKLN